MIDYKRKDKVKRMIFYKFTLPIIQRRHDYWVGNFWKRVKDKEIIL